MSRYRKSLWLIILLLSIAVGRAKCQVYEKKPELHGYIVVLPITIINVYPLIPATVNGVEFFRLGD